MLVTAIMLLSVCLQGARSDGSDCIQTRPTLATKSAFIGMVSVTDFASTKYTTAAFVGIPFALPPARFAKPVLDQPKVGIFRATQFGAVCPQVSSQVRDKTMSEDCLYLNIYVPLRTKDLDSANTLTRPPTQSNDDLNPDVSSECSVDVKYLPIPSKKYAVFIFIHGGAFLRDSGNFYDGSVLGGVGNIIVVTINYRLGVLGFLSTGDDVIPGNLALWDQHTAICWVNEHIQAFGGDTTRITVGGQSAGSYSTIYQGLYEGNKGLFQRMIAQSGNPTAAKSASTVGYITTWEVAQKVGCNVTGTKTEIKACLVSKSVTELLSVQLSMIVPGSLPIQPTVDDPLVTEDPYNLMSEMAKPPGFKKPTIPGHFLGKDLLIGTNFQDGDVVLGLLIYLIAGSNVTALREMATSPISPDTFKQYIRLYLLKDFKSTVDKNLVDSVYKLYTGGRKSTDPYALSYKAIDMITDLYFALPSVYTAAAHSSSRGETEGGIFQAGKSGRGATYVYRFKLPKPGQSAFLPWLNGSGHDSEVSYVFGKKNLVDESDISLSKTMMTYWSNFIKSG